MTKQQVPAAKRGPESMELGYPGLLHDSARAAFSPDRRQVASAGSYSTEGGCVEKLRIWSWPSGRLLQARVLDSNLMRLAWSPDSRRLVAADEHSRVHCLDLSSGELRSRACLRRKPPAGAVAFSPDGGQIAFGVLHSSRKILVLDSRSLDARSELELPASVEGVSALRFESGRLLARHEGGTASFDLESGRCSEDPDASWPLADDDFLPDEERVVARGDDPFNPSGLVYPRSILELSYDSRGDFLACADREGGVYVFDSRRGERVAEAREDGPASASYMSDGLLATSGASGWSLREPETLKVLDRVRSKLDFGRLRCSPCGRWVLAQLQGSKVKVWSYPQRKPVKTFKDVWSAEFAGDGRAVVALSHSGVLRAFELPGGREHDLTELSGAGLVGVPEGFAIGDNKGLRRVSLSGGKTVRRLKVSKLAGLFPLDRALAATPDGALLAMGHGARAVIARGKLVEELRPMDRLITALALRPDGRQLAIGAGSALRLVGLPAAPG